MDTKNNNIAINEFSGGMNSDLSYGMLQPNQYVYGENIRLTSNSFISESEAPNKKEGVVAPIPSGILQQFEENSDSIGEFLDIVSVEQIDNICVVVTKNKNLTWSVYRITQDSNGLNLKKIFTSTNLITKAGRFSTVINKEVNGIVKLYIADGEHQIISMNVNDEFDTYNSDVQQNGGEINFVSNSYFPKNKIQISSKLSGRLPVGQVQYTYRFYKKYGVKSKLAPLTNKIQVFDSTRNRELGNAEGTNTSIGLQLQIQYDSSCSKIFDRIQIFRIYYKKPDVDADIELIYDDKFTSETQTKFNDIGQDALKEYSAEEFSMLDGQDIIPQSIEQNQGYMFAANIEDRTILNLSINDFDAKAYSVNSQGDVVLYRNTDSTYTTPVETTVSNILNSSVQFDLDEYTLNKYADMNVGDEVQDPCRYYVQNNKCYFGGVGKNVSWKFVKIKTPIHDIGNGNDAPVDIHNVQRRTFAYLTKDTQSNQISAEDTGYNTDSYFIEHGILVNEEPLYNNMFTSSMLRSLRRDEVYRYGIILYDKHGSRTDVNWIADIRTPNANELPLTDKGNDYLYAVSLGIQFDVYNLPDDIAGYQIVRCSKDIQYRKNIMQCVVARPIKQQMGDGIWSPYYPHYMLTSNLYEITNGSGNDAHHIYSSQTKTNDQIHNTWYDVYVLPNDTIFQLYSPEIINRRQDSLRDISIADDIQFFGFQYYDSPTVQAANLKGTKTINGKSIIYQIFDKTNLTAFGTSGFLMKNKDQLNLVYNYYDYLGITPIVTKIKQVQDVKNPLWENGFSDVKLGSVSKSSDDDDDDSGETYTGITSATKQYKSFVSSVGDKQYVNWVCNAMYDMKAFKSDINANQHEDGYALIVKGDRYDRVQVASDFEQQVSEDFPYAFEKYTWWRVIYDMGFIGPGPVCFVADIETNNYVDNRTVNEAISVTKSYTDGSTTDTYSPIGVLVSNIRHNAIQYAGLTNAEKQLDVYYGFGNFKSCSAQDNKLIVFDGDVYIVPFEIVQMFKTYDFNSQDTLQSAQFVYYVPIESKINTFLDYCINYMNSKSKTLQLEPGEITGVAMQDRPLSQYSTTMSDNSISNDIYNTASVEKTPTKFSNRIHYSNPKISGEYMDSWLNFAPLNYIDVDSRYGDITCLKSLRNTLYCWQDISFGRISVNERSLVSDTNNNMIQLGKGDVMQRIDYIDTNHGMSPKQYVCVGVNENMYWIDDKNMSIMMSNGTQTANLSERLNIQSTLNERFDNTSLSINHDAQNDELLCKCLRNGNQMVINTKLNVACSVFTRSYVDLVRIYNTLYGISNQLQLYKYNHIESGDNVSYMPSKLIFVVNKNASTTKVFDNQEIVFSNSDDSTSLFSDHTAFQFNTNVDGYSAQCFLQTTTREGNIEYAVPRADNALYGSRMRGKWMKVAMSADGTADCAISHIITKFRQSF